ncbi:MULTISPECIES: Hsp20/alpha crystallin family protein [Mesonia]|uniref:Spore protein SP21 n=1 Tax=Mesonia oceanica TaxID=2687242 RepID=A0AC61Y5X6_9FLAO|nr:MULTISPECIES: Hsp20/alpha crystallin family protein [Mesonia]MAN27220.1 molecular chaperone Hsp20 [Mesonia sp.]MAQ42384.1 molecular chaperone Hsp20 [Mesonia sp.]MBJ98672.1 molecular chaperone Hsp20 [Flavobacteriaceae bacterium]VVU99910.1 Spore protein SP21 [Mesonia oceanica]|tara:strand:+ start:116394 stop:116837 length:444 start_codon:yes stop_codon:yes gene_type:complete
MSLVKRTAADNWLPSIFDDMFKTDWLGGTSNVNNIGVSIPAVNIQETEENFLVEVAAPGKTKEDFNIELDKDVLTISSETKKENKEEEKGKFTRREFSYSTFKRAFSLPETVDSTKINASYENGVLLINLPKKEEAKVQAKRMIEIS